MLADWKSIESAPKGVLIECLWPSYNENVALHQGVCLFKRDWYPLGGKYLETWWTGPELWNPTAKDPLYWRPLE